MEEKRKKIFLITSILFGIIVFGVSLYWIFASSSFSKNKVMLEIKGPSQIVNGEQISFFVTYRNQNNVTLNDAELVFYWPKESDVKDSFVEANFLRVSKKIGDIGPSRVASVTFEGIVFGEKNSQINFEAALFYKPENVSSRFENRESFSSVIASSPISISFDLSSRAVNGRQMDFVISMANNSEREFKNLELRLSYPTGFQFKESDLATFSSDNIWKIDLLPGKGERKLKIKGILSGFEGENKQFSAVLGIIKENNFLIYSQGQSSVQISLPVLSVYQTVNGMRDYSVSSGENLEFRVFYKNTSDVAISNVVIKISLDGRFLDLGRLQMTFGSFDGKNIIWNSSGVPKLSLINPFEEGELRYSVSLKKVLPINSFNDKNLVISSVANINSINVPAQLKGIAIEGEDNLQIKINSNLTLLAKGFYSGSSIKNSGPIPPRVNQKTTYTIVWQLTNWSNDVENVEVTGYLPSYVSFGPLSNVKDGNLIFNPSTGEVKWTIGRVSAFSGVLTTSVSTEFQVTLTPTSVQVGSAVPLISNLFVKGTDSFTSANLLDREEDIYSDSLGDPGFTYINGRVQQ